jgi:hypothetical protein
VLFSIDHTFVHQPMQHRTDLRIRDGPANSATRSPVRGPCVPTKTRITSASTVGLIERSGLALLSQDHIHNVRVHVVVNEPMAMTRIGSSGLSAG